MLRSRVRLATLACPESATGLQQGRWRVPGVGDVALQARISRAWREVTDREAADSQIRAVRTSHGPLSHVGGELCCVGRFPSFEQAIPHIAGLSVRGRALALHDFVLFSDDLVLSNQQPDLIDDPTESNLGRCACAR